jgi:phosphoribosylanthranilate isomerase
MAWDWHRAMAFGSHYPFILAGGLTPENVSRALQETHPAAVDVSSGVESAPGQKNLKKIEAFVKAVAAFSRTIDTERPSLDIFRP